MSSETKLSRIDRFSLTTGIVGLAADTIAIGSFATSLGLISLPSQEPTSLSTSGNLLLTALIGFYSLSLIVWFLLRLERSRQHGEIGDSARQLFDIDEGNASMLGLLLFPLIGSGFLCIIRSTRVIFLLTVFIAFLPATLWIYTFSGLALSACGLGLLGSMTLAQFSTFFALVLDRFFR